MRENQEENSPWIAAVCFALAASIFCASMTTGLAKHFFELSSRQALLYIGLPVGTVMAIFFLSLLESPPDFPKRLGAKTQEYREAGFEDNVSESKLITKNALVGIFYGAGFSIFSALISCALIAADFLHGHGEEAGFSLAVGFIIGPIMACIGWPWSFIVLGLQPGAGLTLILIILSVILNGAILGTCWGICKTLQRR